MRRSVHRDACPFSDRIYRACLKVVSIHRFSENLAVRLPLKDFTGKLSPELQIPVL
ncbi:hypothetical cytosolic protein [Syntrophus aciditrophicus SB]|uniref:Hypothetical cytosolic protein n=1 Tax=Syntrophus aciditrophicus (strain SB) TaxID=56780 RepID=Q2LRN5_SYNAS|nr:hypothetical cytosolic protein [Syntrophus aciditrophicus SB]